MLIKRILRIFFAIIFFCSFFNSIVSCSDTIISKEHGDNDYPIHFLSFSLRPEHNPGLTRVTYATINDSTITLFAPELDSSDSLVPYFEGNYCEVRVNEKVQCPGVTSQDFNNRVRYELSDKKGRKAYYNVYAKVGTGLPRLDINTINNEPIKNKSTYLDAFIRISNCPDLGGAIICGGRIKGRGNASFTYKKKPYRIKFNDKKSPFNFPANKDWVLLADYRDKTLLRTAYMSEVSKLIGLVYTINYQHVDLFINKEYQGTYLLTDLVEKANDRVKIDNDGFLIERDNWYSNEPLYFKTDSLGLYYTFKYPNSNKGDIVENDDNYQFIKGYMNTVEQSFLKLKQDSLNTDFLSYIDIYSFARWYLLCEEMTVFDSNTFYVISSKKSKLEMYPMWDAEYSVGEWTDSWGNHYEPFYEVDASADERLYFNYLLRSPLFRRVVTETFLSYKNNYKIVDNKLSELYYETKSSLRRNNLLWWPYYDNTFFEEEYKKMIEFIELRREWLNNKIFNWEY